MRWLLAATGVIVASGVVVWILGSMLPVNHQATRSASFSVPPSTLHAVIADRERYREWWSDDTPTTLVEHRPPDRMVTRIVDGLPFGGTWTFEITPHGSGSQLTITERGEVYNPIFRVLSRYVIGHTATMDGFLAALRTRTSSLPPSLAAPSPPNEGR